MSSLHLFKPPLFHAFKLERTPMKEGIPPPYVISTATYCNYAFIIYFSGYHFFLISICYRKILVFPTLNGN